MLSTISASIATSPTPLGEGLLSGHGMDTPMTVGCVVVLVALAAFSLVMWRYAKVQVEERLRERRLREELDAYTHLDLNGTVQGDPETDRASAAKALSLRVCRSIADKSAFKRALMLMRDADGRLYCAGSVGVDDLTVAAVERWGEQVVAEERSGAPRENALLGRAGAKSVPISLGEWGNFDAEVGSWRMSGKRERRQFRRAVVLPVRCPVANGVGPIGGRVVGAIVVCPDGMSLRSGGPAARVDRFLSGVESLAGRLGMILENQSLNERLLRAEKLAGLGQMAAGVARALNSPLTSVLGFAELIAESDVDARVREDARMIATEALRMRSTIEELEAFYRPSRVADEAVEIGDLIRQLAMECETKLTSRGVRFELQAGDLTGIVSGSRDRLQQVMEHLMNNAAQAVSKTPLIDVEDEHVIRLSVSQDDKTLYVIVSDTGPGFTAPARAFDPFYLPSDPAEEGLAGHALGLFICQRIVREHGGEIAAFNLDPHGAAVVIELPLRLGFALPEPSVLVNERMIA